jgi:hypothetical protein
MQTRWSQRSLRSQNSSDGELMVGLREWSFAAQASLMRSLSDLRQLAHDASRLATFARGSVVLQGPDIEATAPGRAMRDVSVGLGHLERKAWAAYHLRLHSRNG